MASCRPSAKADRAAGAIGLDYLMGAPLTMLFTEKVLPHLL